MDKTTFYNLQPGDIVRHVSGSDGYIVTGNYGDHITIVRTMDISNPIEWELAVKNSPVILSFDYHPEYDNKNEFSPADFLLTDKVIVRGSDGVIIQVFRNDICIYERH